MKWFVPQNPEETDSDIALNLLDAYAEGRIRLIEPSIWRVEVAAVLARLMPDQLEAQLNKVVDAGLPYARQRNRANPGRANGNRAQPSPF